MTMSIRDFLWARVVQCYAGLLIAFLLVMGGLSLLPPDFSRLVWIPVAILGFAIPFGILAARITCPRCHYPFVKHGWFRLRLGAARYRTNHCPHCGVDLASALSGAPR